MPQIQYTVQIATPVERVWAFVEHLPNWAPLMVGYQKVVEVNDRQSIWTLKGDVGMLTREVDLQADITVWEPLKRVEFTLTGLTEKLSGSGSFTLEPVTGDDTGEAGTPAGESPAAAAPTAPEPRRKRRRLREAFARFQARMMRRMMKRAEGADESVRAAAATIASAAADRGGEGSRLTFELQVQPGGPMAPMLELLMAPMLEPAVSDLTTGIRAALEAG
ncbi:CoxG family protein [Microbispora bryophytorum]|uniref:CoxG family protein n=1 Tax=Microbispora bryophytorum TaxID=1460882 RepID=UPI0033DCA56F